MDDDKLLAAVLRRFILGDGYANWGDHHSRGCKPFMTIDTTVEVDADELAAIERVYAPVPTP